MKKNRTKIQKRMRIVITLLLSVLLCGCTNIGLAQENQFESAYQNTEEEPVNQFVSEAIGIVRSLDETQSTMDFYVPDQKEDRTFSYDGATKVLDKYESGMTIQQLKSGDIVKIAYNGEKEKAGTIQLYDQAWSYDKVERYNLNAGNGIVTIGNETFSLNHQVQIFSDGQAIEKEEIIKQDILSFRGIGHEVVSVVIDKGHGYLELTNTEAVDGGWIEVGQAVIQQILPDMFLTVPEGNYTVRLTANGIEETRDVTIARNQETKLDLGDIEVITPKKGTVLFEVTPQNASISVDQQVINKSYGLMLPFGLHEVTAKASGYETVTQYFYVEEENQTVQIIMDVDKSTVSGNEINDTSNYKVTIETPVGVEVYEDNIYRGVAPVSFTKVPGNHTITLRKTGYVTRSYTVQIDDKKADVSYSFEELEIEKSTVSGNNLPGNTVSGNNIKDKGDKGSSDGTVSGNTVSGNH